MIDLEDLRKRPGAYKKAAKDKGVNVSIDDFLNLDKRRREAIARTQVLQAKKNSVSGRIPTMKDREKKIALEEMKKLADELKKEEEERKYTEEAWTAMQLMLPQIPLESVPVGKDESDNVELEKWGDLPSFNFAPKDHVTLGESLDIIDIPRGVRVAGSRSYFLKGDGARLELAVLQFTIDHLIKKGWTLFIPPVLARTECLTGTGFFPDALEQTYEVEDSLYLIGTSEVSVCSYHMGETFSKSDLPKRYMGLSNCFRREAGTYGKDTRGLYRIHQFQKVEQVALCGADEEEGLEMFEEIRKNAEEVLRALELPYHIMNVCTGDMGKGKLIQHDIETWMPSRNSYGETHSCSYLGDFQARRLNIQYRDSSGKKRFVHTLNNTCIASPRILIPLLEIYQNNNGTVTIPDVLRPYMGGQERITPRPS